MFDSATSFGDSSAYEYHGFGSNVSNHSSSSLNSLNASSQMNSMAPYTSSALDLEASLARLALNANTNKSSNFLSHGMLQPGDASTSSALDDAQSFIHPGSSSSSSSTIVDEHMQAMYNASAFNRMPMSNAFNKSESLAATLAQLTSSTSGLLSSLPSLQQQQLPQSNFNSFNRSVAPNHAVGANGVNASWNNHVRPGFDSMASAPAPSGLSNQTSQYAPVHSQQNHLPSASQLAQLSNLAMNSNPNSASLIRNLAQSSLLPPNQVSSVNPSIAAIASLAARTASAASQHQHPHFNSVPNTSVSPNAPFSNPGYNMHPHMHNSGTSVGHPSSPGLYSHASNHHASHGMRRLGTQEEEDVVFERERDLLKDMAFSAPSRQVFVGNLIASVTEEELLALFSPFGELEIIKNFSHLGYAFCVFKKLDCAIRAKEEFTINPPVLAKRRIVVNFGKPLVPISVSRPKGNHIATQHNHVGVNHHGMSGVPSHHADPSVLGNLSASHTVPSSSVPSLDVNSLASLLLAAAAASSVSMSAPSTSPSASVASNALLSPSLPQLPGLTNLPGMPNVMLVPLPVPSTQPAAPANPNPSALNQLVAALASQPALLAAALAASSASMSSSGFNLAPPSSAQSLGNENKSLESLVSSALTNPSDTSNHSLQ